MATVTVPLLGEGDRAGLEVLHDLGAEDGRHLGHLPLVDQVEARLQRAEHNDEL